MISEIDYEIVVGVIHNFFAIVFFMVGTGGLGSLFGWFWRCGLIRKPWCCGLNSVVLVRLSGGFWPGIRKDVESHVKKCAVRTLCQLT